MYLLDDEIKLIKCHLQNDELFVWANGDDLSIGQMFDSGGDDGGLGGLRSGEGHCEVCASSPTQVFHGSDLNRRES